MSGFFMPITLYFCFMQKNIFSISSEKDFQETALEVFKYQYQNNKVYQRYCNLLGKSKKTVKAIEEIPFLPIKFFKTNTIISTEQTEEIIFSSSGTTGSITSKHYVNDLSVYEQSYLEAFKLFYGDITEYCVLALLPSYLERKGSSLIYMVEDLIQRSNHSESGFYLNNHQELSDTLLKLDKEGQKVLLIGVSFALLDFIKLYTFNLKNTTVMETGGMKGRRKEITRFELHHLLKEGFGVSEIHSEYGMTELLSQAYSLGNGIFQSPPWMKILTRNTENPLEIIPNTKTGGLNVIDLANYHSCSFIATQDLGKVHDFDRFEVLGRFDNSDIRGCNLMSIQ